MESTVFVLTTGSYSDYSIVGVFSTKEKEAEFRQAFPSSDYNEVETYPFDSNAPSLRANGYSLYQLYLLRDGITEKITRISSPSTYELSQVGNCKVWRRSTAPAYAGKGIQDCIDIIVWAKSDVHAIKIASEKRAQLIASDGWPLTPSPE